MELRGKRVELRPTTGADAPALAAILATPEVARWWPAFDLARVEAELTGRDEDVEVYAILVEGRIVGAIQSHEETDPEFRHAGIDLFLDPELHGQGLGPEAIRTLARFLIAERGHHRLTIDPAVANERAIRAYEKVGSGKLASCAVTSTILTGRGRMVSSWTCLPRSCAAEAGCEIAIEPESKVSCANPVRLGRLLTPFDSHPRVQEGPLPTSFAARTRVGFIRATTVFAVGTLLLGGLAPVASADGGLEVTTAYPAVAVAPGSKVSFDLKVTSTRAGDVALSVDAVPTGWTATLHGGGFVVDGVSAGPGVDATARLDISVPGDATASTQTLRVNASLGSTRDVLPIGIRVDAGAAGDITITTNTPTLTGPSNGNFPFALTLHNDTAQDVTVSATASVTDHADWEVKAEIAGQQQAASTVVEAGSTTSINVTATPPENAPAGDYKVHVDVKAGEQTIPGDFGVTLTGSYSMTVTTPGQLLSAHGSAGGTTQQDFIITNTGTAPITNVKLTATPPTAWDVTFEPATVESIAPNEAATIAATIKPSGDAIAGDYQISFAGASDQADATAAVRFTVETSPIWALVGIGLIAAILVGLFYVFRTYGRR